MNESDKQKLEAVGLPSLLSGYANVVEYQHPPAELHIRKVAGGYIVGSSDGTSRHHWHAENRQRVAGDRTNLVRELRDWLDVVDPRPAKEPKPETTAAAPAQVAK